MGSFTAYCNEGVKAMFTDRTIVRMMRNCSVIRILNKRAEELYFNLQHPNAAIADYNNYIKITQEFLDWAFSTPEERQRKEE